MNTYVYIPENTEWWDGAILECDESMIVNNWWHYQCGEWQRVKDINAEITTFSYDYTSRVITRDELEAILFLDIL